MSDASLQRAKLNRNQILHILPPQYHGNPVGGESLVVQEFGWDLLDVCRGAGFRDAYMLAYYSSFYGYLGDGLQYVFVAEC